MQIGTRPNELPETKPTSRATKNETVATATVFHYQRPVEDRKADKKSTVWRLDPKRYSNWTRLVRVLGRVRRFIHNTQNSETRVSDQSPRSYVTRKKVSIVVHNKIRLVTSTKP